MRWEDNRRFGVALAMRHRLQWFIHLQTGPDLSGGMPGAQLNCGSLDGKL